MVSINTNLSSIIVQRNMAKSTNALNLAIERMTTGAKLNHAKDNAAGYSISKDMDSKISSYAVAQDNIAMGLDMIATAQDNISLMQGHGQRIMDLWTQAQNGTYGTDSMDAIQSEVNARLNEIDRLYKNAEYNDISLFENYSIELPDWAETVASTAGLSSDISASNNGFIEEFTPKSQAYVDALTSVEGLSNFNGASEFKIDSVDALVNLADLVNSDVDTTGKTFYLASDLDLSSFCATNVDGVFHGWRPIGGNYWDNVNDELEDFYFKGIFDGNGHTISGLSISLDEFDTDEEEYSCIGLFGQTDEDSIIRNVGLKNVSINGGNAYDVGGLAGRTIGSITNSYATGTVTGQGDYVGGLVGRSESSITNSYATGAVTGQSYTGGLAGSVGSSITNSYATGTVKGQGSKVGGLVGETNGSIGNSYATGTVTGQGDYVGGLVGRSESSITNSYATGAVTGQSYTGGLAGRINGNITNSYATGTVTGYGTLVGGLAGQAGGINDSYATGTIMGQSYTGGLVGWASGNISNCYSTGNVKGKVSVGGLVGYTTKDISTSYATGNVSGTLRVGGLIGEIYKTTSGTLTVNKTASFGNVTRGDVVGSLVGGIVDTTNGSTWRTVTFTNAQARNQGLNAVGGEFKYASSTYTPITHAIDTWNSAISLIDLPFPGTILQVGINGDSSSQISFDSNLSYSLDVSDIRSAGAYNSIKAFLDSLSEKATQLGAVSNRLESALESTTTQINNLTSSLSTIKDADIAHVSSQYIRNQILQQAGATLLATANQSPSIALQLL